MNSLILFVVDSMIVIGRGVFYSYVCVLVTSKKKESNVCQFGFSKIL